METLGELGWQRSLRCGEHKNCYEANLPTGAMLEVHRTNHVWFWGAWGPWMINEEGHEVRRPIAIGGEAKSRRQAIEDAEKFWEEFNAKAR